MNSFAFDGVASPSPESVELFNKFIVELGFQRYGAESSGVDDGYIRGVMLRQEHVHNPLVVAHESFHAYLMARKKFTNETMRLEFGANRDARKEYFALCNAIEEMVLFEDGLPQAKKAMLQRALGEAEEYDYAGRGPVNETLRAQAAEGKTYLSCLGNVVDESATLSALADARGGHPMHDFHEFFASAMNSCAHDGEKMRANILALKGLSLQDGDFASLYKKMCLVLSACARIGEGIPEELGAVCKKYGMREEKIGNMKANLEGLAMLSGEAAGRAERKMILR